MINILSRVPPEAHTAQNKIDKTRWRTMRRAAATRVIGHRRAIAKTPGVNSAMRNQSRLQKSVSRTLPLLRSLNIRLCTSGLIAARTAGPTQAREMNIHGCARRWSCTPHFIAAGVSAQSELRIRRRIVPLAADLPPLSARRLLQIQALRIFRPLEER